MARTRNEARVEQARALASEGKTVTEIAAEVGVDRRTVQRWGITGQAGRPKVSDEQASPRTRRRRRSKPDGEPPQTAGVG